MCMAYLIKKDFYDYIMDFLYQRKSYYFLEEKSNFTVKCNIGH